MRHRVYGKKLGLNKNKRAALFKSLVRSLIISEKIETIMSNTSPEMADNKNTNQRSRFIPDRWFVEDSVLMTSCRDISAICISILFVTTTVR